MSVKAAVDTYQYSWINSKGKNLLVLDLLNAYISAVLEAIW